MKIIEPGHIYQLQHLDGSGAGILVFVNREPGTEHEGVQTQEILRALIDRTQHCDNCLRWEGNDKIIEHLRMALVLHEARALERKTEKGELKPEQVPTGNDGHFRFDERFDQLRIDRRTLDQLSIDESERQAHEQNLNFVENCHINIACSRACPRGTRGCVLLHAIDNTVRYPPVIIPRDSVVPVPAKTIGRPAEPTANPVCTTPMCGESSVCDECKKRGAR